MNDFTRSILEWFSVADRQLYEGESEDGKTGRGNGVKECF